MRLLFDVVTISLNIHSPFAAASHSQAAEEEEGYHSKADEDFAAELHEGKSLGDFDTDINAEEVEDLEAILEEDMAPVAPLARRACLPRSLVPRQVPSMDFLGKCAK